MTTGVTVGWAEMWEGLMRLEGSMLPPAPGLMTNERRILTELTNQRQVLPDRGRRDGGGGTRVLVRLGPLLLMFLWLEVGAELGLLLLIPLLLPHLLLVLQEGGEDVTTIIRLGDHGGGRVLLLCWGVVLVPGREGGRGRDLA